MSDQTTFRVEFREVSSGGTFKLSIVDYDAMFDLGWDTNFRHRCATKEFSGVNDDDALTRAQEDFESATKFSSEEEGCPCCGVPFNFIVLR